MVLDGQQGFATENTLDEAKSIQFQEVLSYVSPLTVSIMPLAAPKLTKSQN
jgi:hypothetical protein